MRWLDFLFPPRSDEECIRSLSEDSFLALLTPTLVTETRPETIALLPFSNKTVRSALHEAKYHGSGQAFTLLGEVLTEYLRDTDEGFRRPVIIPLPLGAAREKERGFNQVEEVAKRAKELDIPIATDILFRVRETVSQVSLPREQRKENMRGAFAVKQTIDPARTYILIDDVITTGATLQSAIDALTSAGAKHVVSLALAH